MMSGSDQGRMMENRKAGRIPPAIFAAIALVTVVQIYVPAVVGVTLASAQAALGALFFLHLRDESRRLSLVILFPLVLSAIFIVAIVFFETWGIG